MPLCRHIFCGELSFDTSRICYIVASMALSKPDMRVFNRSVRDDHAMFDGCLVAVCENSSNWTRSKIRNAPVTLDHFREDAQRRIAEGIAGTPELKGQDVSDRRLLLRHLAHRLTVISGNYIHAVGDPLSEVLVHIRTNLALVARNRCIVLQDPDHPLQEHPRIKYERLNTSKGQENMATLPAAAEDAALAKYIVGPNPHMDSQTDHTESLLRKWVPYLIDVDSTHLVTEMKELRMKLLQMLRSQPFLFPELRLKLLNVVLADWKEEYFSGGHEEEFNRIEDEVQAETGVREIFNQSDDEILRQCFEKQLSPAEIPAEMAEKLLSRKPALEHLVMQATDRQDWELLQRVANAFSEYTTKLRLDIAHLGHLGIAMLTQSRNMEMDTLKDALT